LQKLWIIYALTPEGEGFLNDSGERLRKGVAEPKGLLPYCKWVANKKGHAEWYFNGFKDRLLDLYRELIPTLLKNMKLDLPLVIADEAHHWRRSQRQDCQGLSPVSGSARRRLLLLTATPFQLHRDELLEVLATGDSMEPAIGADRVESLRGRRNQLAEAMNASEEMGRAFSLEWGSLAEQMARLDPKFSATLGQQPTGEDPAPRKSKSNGVDYVAHLAKKSEGFAKGAGALRPFFARAVNSRTPTYDFHEVMAPLIVRHRRRTEHRRYWLGGISG